MFFFRGFVYIQITASIMIKLTLILLLFFVPVLEILILMQLNYIMPLSTIFLQCVVTLAAGVWLMQREHFSLWTIVESELHNNRLPAEEVVADLLLLGGGFLLIVPGLLTDALGLGIFIPAVRQECILQIRISMKKTIIEKAISEKNEYVAKAFVLTTGTFLNGAILIGHTKQEGGRIDEKKSTGLEKFFENHQLQLGRLKTGTPPRLSSKTINFIELSTFSRYSLTFITLFLLSNFDIHNVD